MFTFFNRTRNASIAANTAGKKPARKSAARKGLLALAAVAMLGSGMAAAPAQARDRDDHREYREYRDFDRHEHRDYDRGFSRFGFDIRIGERYPVRERVWCEPVYRTECVRVWVPDRYEEVCRTVGYGRECREIRERVCVERGHWVDENRQVLVVAGHWD